MKATGIVRRIDDLGRVVIPKEIRRTLRFAWFPFSPQTGEEGERVVAIDESIATARGKK